MADGLTRDIAAFEAADAEFERLHGAEARERWTALGADPDAPLLEQQTAVVRERGPAPEVWDAFAWETQLRIDLVEEARAKARAEARS